jgi:hypothetical protein
VKTISEIIGHSAIRLTQDIYEHVFKEPKQSAAAAMERVLNPVAARVATKEPSSDL